MAKDRVWLPLQGGLPPVAAPTGAVVEIACDESGFSGTNLLDPATPVITHASVDLSVGEAVTLIGALRSGFRHSPDEVKSGRFLRGPNADEALTWLLTALNGRAHVHLVDKEYFLVTRIVDLFLNEPSYAAGTRLTRDHRPAALGLYRTGRSAGADWGDFLAAFVELVRIKRRHQPDRPAFDRFFRARQALVRAGLGAPAAGVLDGLDPVRVWSVLTRMSDDDRSIPPPLEPLLPALAETVLFWSGGKRQVLVVHDEQSALTADRLRRLQQILADGAPLTDLDSISTAPADRDHTTRAAPTAFDTAHTTPADRDHTTRAALAAFDSACTTLTDSGGTRTKQADSDGTARAESAAFDGAAPAAFVGGGAPRVSPLAGLVTVDSRDDPRVQVADLLAGVARRLTGTAGDGPLQPFLSPTSLRDPER